MIKNGKKIMIFPVETTVRELDFRLVLASLCSRPDWQIIIGEHEHLFPFTLQLRNALIVLKNLTRGKRHWKYQRYQELNTRIVHLDEEGAIFQGDPEFWKTELKQRLDASQLGANDYSCAWGRFQARFYASVNPARAGNIVPTGHPRFDLCRPRFHPLYRKEVDALRAKHGKIILVNTNFLSNNALGLDAHFKWRNVTAGDVERRTWCMDQYCYEAHRQTHFIHLINHLSNACPHHTIIFRPHPSEDIRIYNTLFQYVPRVVVTRENSLNAWLHASEVLIHDGCTTAIEGHFSGTPVINFRPLSNPQFDIVLPNLVGTPCRTAEDVVAAIERIGDAAPAIEPEKLNLLTDLFINADPAVDSFALVSNIISKCQNESPPTLRTGHLPPLLWRRLIDPIGRITRPSPKLRRLFHSRDRGFDKFPPLDEAKIKEKLGIIGTITGKPVRAVFHTSKIFSILPA
jgi:surface carbohydrate biosynthesis protein